MTQDRASVTVTPRKTAAFISFDYDHDLDLKNLLVGQSKNGDSPFAISDWSIKSPSRGWRSEARQRIAQIDRVIVLCGHHTHRADGVAAEVEIARELGKPYFLLRGRRSGWVRRPRGTWFWETVHPWTWENLRALTALEA